MAVIQELPSHLADLIAAGEVVERPASVAKELIENAIDAGATRIQVEIENGGITYLRILDNGSGIAAEDAPTAFRRHATSKLRTEADLGRIGTLGFRGEALAAIAAVSRIDMFTKQKNYLVGRHLRLEAGSLTENEDAGCPDGTTIVIRDLFFNTPARMKFLKKDFTEAGYIMGVVQHAALSHPEIGFTMIRDGKSVFSTSGDGRLFTPVYSVFGREITENMIEVARFEQNSVLAWGYITKPHYCRPNRSLQHFFVNGRYIKSRLIQAAVEEAFRNRIITGKYPSGAIFIELPLQSVDVNVHPAKTEVKFSQEKAVFQAVYIACKNALEIHDNVPILKAAKASVPREDHLTAEQQSISYEKISIKDEPKSDDAKSVYESASPVLAERWLEPSAHKVISPRQFSPIVDADDDEEILSLASPDIENITKPVGIQKLPSVEPKKPVAESKTSVPTETAFVPSAHVIGEAFYTYIIAEDDQGILLIDKHAAHERIIFNELRVNTKVVQQNLLTAYIAEMEPKEYAVLLEHQELVISIGFDIESFGENSFAVRAIPSYLDAGDVSAVLSEVADKLSASRAPTPDQFDDLIHTVACKAAIKSVKNISRTELQHLCNRVLQDPEVTACPHGRPVMVRLTKYEIDKLFKRVNQ